MNSFAGKQRYHGLDALRAAMMLLGVFLHAGLNYMPYRSAALTDAWPRDMSTSPFFDFSFFFIHAFRMPVFFLMAGFFAALLYRRAGPVGFARNRVRRVLLPLVLFWPPVLLLLAAGVFHLRSISETAVYGASVPFHVNGGWLQRYGLIHLWFLYFLLIFYAGTLFVGAFANREAFSAVRKTAHRWFRVMLLSPSRLLILAAPTFAAVCAMKSGTLDSSAGFVPDIRVLVVYALFFGCGWLLHEHSELLESFQKRAVLYAAVGVLLGILHSYWMLRLGSSPERGPAFYAAALSVSLCSWTMAFGLTGLAMRHFSGHRPVIRYLTDSSYWVYLVHLPVAAWVPALVARLQWPAEVKAAVVIAIMLALLLGSYQLLVRRTRIGMLLNGRRYSSDGRAGSAILLHEGGMNRTRLAVRQPSGSDRRCASRSAPSTGCSPRPQ